MDYLNENINMMMLEYEEKLGERTNHIKNEFALIRAGRVNSAIVERVSVDYFGTPTPLKNLANISCSDSRTIVINLWDTAIIRETSRALENANLGANPIDDGRIIRMIFPQLTADRRKELVKQVKTIAENGRVAMRNDRRSALDTLKKIVKDEKLSEDDQSLVEKDVQKLLDTYISSLDRILEKKETDILAV